MLRVLEELDNDLRNSPLGDDFEQAFAKLKCEPEHGKRIYWYFKEDATYAKECYGKASAIKRQPPYSGIMVAAPDTEVRGGIIDEDDCIVIMDRYPVEKCYCEATYMTLERLLSAKDLVEVFDILASGTKTERVKP